MSFNIDFIKAETHTPEYLMHKYWARKPHNVISECIKGLTSEGDIVLDPFCGSGVTLREASLLGRESYGFDLNPAAGLISKVLLYPPRVEEFLEKFESIYNEALLKYGYLYKTNDGKIIKYLSHRIIARCCCGEKVTQGECKKEGRKLLCPKCGKTVHFNLESLVDTEIFNIAIENDKNYTVDECEKNRQKELSEYLDETINVKQYDYLFPENKRILAYNGINTSSLFTNRNFSIISFFANSIWKIENEKIRDCSLLLLTASVAQCSRLIANRNDLSTGGPAWSVPGFWVPQEHLESNPFVHIKARMQKFKKALEALAEKPAKAKSEIYCGNSLVLLNDKKFKSLKADLIFLDPPYGDSVPYTEFSNIWNSFLKEIPKSDEDISVSDRIDKNISWNNYREKLDQYMECFSKHLSETGKLLITFNNNDMRAWTSLLAALQNNKFVCKNVFYQIPAVISSKAQMSLKSSYISDVYSVYTYNPNMQPTRDLSPLLTHLCFIANARGSKVPKVVLDREFIITWLKNNMDYKLLEEKENIINSVFDYDKQTNMYFLKEKYIKEVPQLEKIVSDSVNKLLQKGTQTLLDVYLEINRKYEEFGTMEISEFKNILSDYVIENGKIYGCTQLSLF